MCVFVNMPVCVCVTVHVCTYIVYVSRHIYTHTTYECVHTGMHVCMREMVWLILNFISTARLSTYD